MVNLTSPVPSGAGVLREKGGARDRTKAPEVGQKHAHLKGHTRRAPRAPLTPNSLFFLYRELMKKKWN